MRRASTALVAALALVPGACTAAPADRAQGAAPVRPALELADVLDDLAANSTDTLDAIGALLAAVESGDVDGELAAAAELDAVAAEARAVNLRMLEAMEDVDPSAPEVADLRGVLERLGG